jgi:hypothetical protein
VTAHQRPDIVETFHVVPGRHRRAFEMLPA